MAFPFDTLKFVETLIEADMPKKQARALCYATLNAWQEFLAYQLYMQKLIDLENKCLS